MGHGINKASKANSVRLEESGVGLGAVPIALHQHRHVYFRPAYRNTGTLLPLSYCSCDRDSGSERSVIKRSATPSVSIARARKRLKPRISSRTEQLSRVRVSALDDALAIGKVSKICVRSSFLSNYCCYGFLSYSEIRDNATIIFLPFALSSPLIGRPARDFLASRISQGSQ